MGPPSYMRSVVDRKVVMRRIIVHLLLCVVTGLTFKTLQIVSETQ
jgi:hypothetical protein